MVALRAGSATDVGLVRSNNQDAFLAADSLYAVADGMGGAAAGEVASAIAIEALNNGFSNSGPHTSDRLIQATQAANRAVWDEAEANPEMRGMGTTLVAIALVEGPHLAIVNIGDSRLYVLREGELRQVTFDHNLVAELVAEGRITPAEAEVHPRRNIMTRALGVEPEVPIDLFVEDPVVGDRYLLCSDGLPREVSDDLIAALLRRIGEPQEAARELVEEAKRKGGNDNITVVVVDIVSDESPVDGADATTAIPAGLEPDTGPDTGQPRREEADIAAGTPEPAPKKHPTRSALNLRVVAFILVLLLIVGAAAAAVVWYARSSYFVGLRGAQIVIYQGRPGGVLGLDPTLKATSGYTTSDVLPSSWPALKAGQEESSVSAAQQYIRNLVAAHAAAQAQAAGPTTSAPTTSAPTTTTVPVTP